MKHPANDPPAHPVRRRLRGVNIPRFERAFSAVAGAALAAMGVGLGLRRRDVAGGVVGGVLAGLGASLLARGISGRSFAYRRFAKRAGADVWQSIVIDRERHEVYAALRDLRRTPRFMSHIVSVVEHGHTADWTAEIGPVKLEWTSEITQDMPALRLAWRSLPGGDVDHVGVIDLEDGPDGAGTLVTISLRFEPPGGPFAAQLRRLFRRMTSHQLARDLERLRRLLEARADQPMLAPEPPDVVPRTNSRLPPFPMKN